jgi:hypothetical protein
MVAGMLRPSSLGLGAAALAGIRQQRMLFPRGFVFDILILQVHFFA